MQFLYQDDDLIIIDKEASYHVHPPEDGYPVPRSKVCLYLVRDAIGGQWIYPVHRLDAGTSGVLVFAKSSEMASKLCLQFAEHTVRKSYWAVARGYTPESGSIERPLEAESSGNMMEARTDFERLATVELPFAVGKRFPTVRYSLLKVHPHTGRFHQIRRHLGGLSHPLLGDSEHGDSHHNRFFREQLGFPTLCLRAYRLEFLHPRDGRRLVINAPVNSMWERVQSLFKDFDLAQKEP